MGLESFSCANAMGMEIRLPIHQQALPKALYENGDAKKAEVHRQAERPLRLVRREGRFYALPIRPKYLEAFTVNMDGQLLQLCALPIGWSLSPYTFQKCTDVLVNKLRDPEAIACPGRLPNLSAKAKKK
jgi:hypothetical protein